MLLTLTVWIVCAIIAAIIAGNKNRSGGAWFFLTLILTPLMLLIVLALPAAELDEREMATHGLRKCPFCAEEVKAEAVICKHCGKDLPKMEVAPDPVIKGKTICPACSAPVGREAFYCKCGTALR